MAAPLKLDYISDWRKRLQGRIFTQFRNKAVIEALAQLLGRQAQDVEDATQTLLTIWDIANSSGVQLDRIGRTIGQPRTGVSDSSYRLYLYGRVLVNRSTGTPEDFFDIVRAIYGSTSAPRYFGGLVKVFVITVTGLALTRAQALIGASLVGDATESGARAIFKWGETTPPGLFSFAGIDPVPTTTLSLATLFGDTAITLAGGADFPSSGRVSIGVGRPVFREYIDYTAKTFNGTNWVLTLVAPGLTHFYQVGVRVDATTIGSGFDGGAFAGAVEA